MKKIAQGIDKCIGAERLETTEFQAHDIDHKVKCTECIVMLRTVCTAQHILSVAMCSEKRTEYPRRAKTTKRGKTWRLWIRFV